MSLLQKIFGDPNKKTIEKIMPIVRQINDLESKFESFSFEELRDETKKFKERLEKGEKLDDILPEAFAVVRETAKRVLGQRHFDAQLIGGVVLHRGQIAEMKTGEGKTLTATLAVYLNALTGGGVHVVTVNDYLAKRDAVWMGQVYNALGLSVGCVQHESAFLYDPGYKGETPSEEGSQEASFKVVQEFLRPVPRKESYAADILYGTNNEFGFDYLRDNMVTSFDNMVQRELNYAIIDEVDSILIDEARTPLIISAPAEESGELYAKFADLVRRLKENEDYNIDEKMRAATLTEAGIAKMEKWLGVENIYTSGGITMVHHIEQALRAETLFKRDRDYVVREGEVIIVDEFTGRLMIGRRYSEGLHQAIEAKEGVRVREESKTLATVTFQNLFRLYGKLAGMTGTALTEAEEFSKIYNLEVVSIPTNKQMIRVDLADRIYRTEQGKFTAVVREIKERYEKGQPVLVGTISIEKNEILSAMLLREGVPHKVLNAKHHEKEAEIIAQAGHLGAVTVATNMAGRGVDIILGGNPADPKEAKKIRELGGLHILGTERHESRRIDNQLRGRAGRQGDPGSSQFYLSLEDDLMRIFAGDRLKGLMTRLNMPEDMPIENRMVSRSLESAQRRVEGHNFDIRKHLLDYDDVLNKHREVIYKKRRDILAAEDSKAKVLEMVEDEIEQVVLFHTASEQEGEWNLEEIYEVVSTIFPVPPEARIKMDDLRRWAGDKMHDAAVRTRIIEYLMELARKAYEDLEKRIAEQAAKINQDGVAVMRQIEKAMTLRAIDSLWVDHLSAVDYLRTGIGLRGYGQHDPLVEYKKETYRMFQELIHFINREVVYNIYKIGLETKTAPSLLQRQGVKLSAPAKEGDNRNQAADIKSKPRTAEGEKIGRNDPCPCGSGQKYKKCCGK
ncbi:preprotein translocase subunit SecA [Candidatus Falkowbacteria bacterium]|nr:preprotein translocase subunit SecA [Candidatus Falkowbacteria bacterium]